MKTANGIDKNSALDEKSKTLMLQISTLRVKLM